MLSAEKDYFTYEMFYTNIRVNTKYKSRAETQNIFLKKDETEKNIIENHQTKTAERNRRKKNNGDIVQPENKR